MKIMISCVHERFQPHRHGGVVVKKYWCQGGTEVILTGERISKLANILESEILVLGGVLPDRSPYLRVVK